MMEQGLLMRFVVGFFFDDSDSEDEDRERCRLKKIVNYAEEIVPFYNDRQFQSHFRMSPTTFESLLTKLEYVSRNNNEVRAGGNPEVTLEKQLMIMLWYLSNLECYRSVADRFGVSTSTAWLCVQKICRKLLIVNTTYNITTIPDQAQYNNIIHSFVRKNHFPGICGVIDGSHIPIIAPSENGVSYINRKNFHSVLLQGVCDNRKRFWDCYAGEAGSIHDACLLRRSPLGQQLNNMQFPENGHLLGDSAYPLTVKILVPYKDNGHLTAVQRNYNEKLSKCRVIIECAYALLKGRFRRLKLLECTRMDLIPVTIISACILHNVCLDADDVPNDINLEAELEEERVMRPDNVAPFQQRENNAIAQAKRNNIANMLYARH